MATEERLPSACAFAISVLAEHDQDPYIVPEEALEAAQQHMVTCARCVASLKHLKHLRRQRSVLHYVKRKDCAP